MKTSLEERLKNASARMKANARSAFKHPISSILSLCMITGMAATSASFSQTGVAPTPNVEVAAPQNTIPAVRTLTDTKGRALKGTILAKSDTAITFQRESDPADKKFEIKLDALSPDDQAFIATLVPEEPKKVSVLFMITNGYETKPYFLETLKWLRNNNNYNVTLGMHYPMGDIPKTEKVVLVQSAADIDTYDILWILQFETYKGNLGITHFEIGNHRNKANQLMVVAIGNKASAHKKIYETAGNASRMVEPDDNFVRTEDNWIFYSKKIDGKGEKQLLDKISKKLAELQTK